MAAGTVERLVGGKGVGVGGVVTLGDLLDFGGRQGFEVGLSAIDIESKQRGLFRADLLQVEDAGLSDDRALDKY